MVSRKEELKKKVNLDKVPEHVAIIMDGNGRWARQKGLPRIAGHRAGVESIRELIKTALELNIKIITLFAFSTENWKRPKKEVEFLMSLPQEYLKKELDNLFEQGVKINMIGDEKDIPPKTMEAVQRGIEKTKNNEKLILNFALNYGGRKEILDAVKKIASKVKEGELEALDINENVLCEHMYTKDIPDPSLLIRPSGEMRISNFLLWQMAYSELWFSPVYWPDFRAEHLMEAVYEYQNRERRFGGVKF